MSKWICLDEKEVDIAINELSKNIFDPKIEKIILKLNRTKNTISVSSRKQKGRLLQYWCSERIAKLFNVKYEQGNDSSEVSSRPMGQHGTDIILRGKVKKLFPFSIETKSSESMSLPAFIKQAKDNTEKGNEWMVVYRSRMINDPVVIIEWNTFEKLWKKELQK